ncbi:MAG: DUF2490 domain-containing protein [Flavihumibacter sp.]|nr:DUF2490 domain-containing protein [Flavihumibacter sp.]
MDRTNELLMNPAVEALGSSRCVALFNSITIMNKILTTILLAGSITKMQAQQRPKTGAWLTVQLPVSTGKKTEWHNDASYRTMGNQLPALQYLYRTGLRYHFNKKWSSAAGVAFFYTRTSFSKDNHEFGREFRTWQEMQYQQLYANKKIQLLLRGRTEQRFYQPTTTKTAYTAHRWRAKAAITYHINNKWLVAVFNEYMRQYQSGKWGFDQNRVQLLAGVKAKHKTQFQLGYMYVSRPDNISQHLLLLTFQKNI